MMIFGLQSHLCLFSGWLREFHGPGFLEVVAPQLLSKKVWVSCDIVEASKFTFTFAILWLVVLPLFLNGWTCMQATCKLVFFSVVYKIGVYAHY